MNIAQILGGSIPYPSRYGGAVEKYVENLSFELRHQGNLVDVIARGKCRINDDAIYLFPDIHSNENLLMKTIHSVQFSVQLRKLERLLEYDILHIHGGIPGDVISRMLKDKHKNMIVTIHDLYLLSENPIEKCIATLLESDVSSRVSAVIAVSSMIKHMLEKSVHNKMVVYIPLGINQHQRVTKSVARSRLGITETTVILFVGRITREKGLHILVQALHILNKSGGKAPLLCIAGPPNKDFGLRPSGYFIDLMDYVTIAGLGNRVKYFGMVHEKTLEDLYCSADLVIVPSMFEAAGYVALESMSYGVPVIASETGGLLDSVVPNKNGVFFEPGNAYDLAEKIQSLLIDRELLEILSSGCVDHIAENYSWRRVAHSVSDLYRIVLSQ